MRGPVLVDVLTITRPISGRYSPSGWFILLCFLILGSLEEFLEDLSQVRVLELKAFFEGDLGDGALADEGDVGLHADDATSQLHGESGGGGAPGAVGGVAHGGHEVFVLDRLGADAVNGTFDFGLGGPAEHAGEVSQVDPGDPLVAVPDRTAEEAFGEFGELGEGATISAEDEADAEFNLAGLGDLGLILGAFPGEAGFGEEVVSGGAGFVFDLVAGVSVIADGAGVDPDLGGRFDGADGLGHEGGGFHPAVEDFLLVFVGPRQGDGFADEVDEGERTVHVGGPIAQVVAGPLGDGGVFDEFGGAAEDDDLVVGF